MTDAQIEAVSASIDVQEDSALAHLTAQALVPTAPRWQDSDPAVADRVRQLVHEEGIEPVAESWVNSPEESLPGIMWRGYLLREWIRRFPSEVEQRFGVAAKKLAAGGEQESEKLSATPGMTAVMDGWNALFSGEDASRLADVLEDSAKLTDTLAEVDPDWIESASHPLATVVTRRDRALDQTSREFSNAAELARKGTLQ